MKFNLKRPKTLSFQLILTMVLLVAGTIGLCLFLNNYFLERYYILDKQKQLVDGYHVMDSQASVSTLDSKAFDIPFEKLCADRNLMIIIIDKQRNIIRSSTNNAQSFQLQMSDIIYEWRYGKSQVLESSDYYMVEKQKDRRTQADYLALTGNLCDGSFIYMRTALESIRESAAVTNRFFFYVGVLALMVSTGVIIFLSMSISKPILQLSDISRRMSNLEFEVKYVPGNNSSLEIDNLGNSMNELSETLENTISELKEANNRLKQDIQIKEQIDEMRKEFLSNVSHELKTPLALIQGYSEGLAECVNDDEESRKFYCDVIIDETNKMNQMVKKLLTLNQLENGNETVHFERFDLTELIRGVIRHTALMAEQKGIRISFPESGKTFVWGDEFKVEEVITNYLSNAMNHASGEKRVDIYYQMKKDCLRVCVLNTGNPIPEEELDKIWQKFYKVDKARTREYGGNGIGLSIVKAIMDSFHQKCGVINHENGVEFWFELETNSKDTDTEMDMTQM